MRKLSSKEIRDTFLNFFKERGHEVLSSASLIPKDDPTLLWNNAGVTPLKKYFDGSVVPENKRMTNCQKCIRTSDIESVGDNTHHTFFEMLGNFSIGDYFKKEAIEWSYELLTSEKYFGFDKEKLYFTVYSEDEDAKNLWLNLGVDESHIIKLDTNFWEIGEGPCGPDSEIFYDRGIKYDKDNIGIRLLKEDIPNERYVEIWNNVFSQYNAREGQEREEYKELPSKNIDTGMGLERMVTIIQEKESSYDTDLFSKTIETIEALTNVKYENKKEFRIIADHIRTLTFAIADGAVFSNEGRGYVLRRLLRRAFIYGRGFGLNEPFMYKIVDSVVESMGEVYNYLYDKKEYIKDIVLKEEQLFLKTIHSGEKKLLELIELSNDKTISGKDAFKLYDTYGFPFELTLELLEEKGYSVSKDEFDRFMNNQKELARNSRKQVASMNMQNEALLNFKSNSKFVGYEDYQCKASVIGLFKEDKQVLELEDEGLVILDITPFYAEMGGQVGDTGYIYNEDIKLEVIDTIKAPNLQHLHIVNVEEGKIKIGDEVTARIHVKRRSAIEKNHSATHLLHEALKEALTEEVVQAGSKVDEYGLRFDFNYSKQINETDILYAESLVNEKIGIDLNTVFEEMHIDDAKKKGAVALFTEKYDNIVRVVTLYDSIELCGGTHVKNIKDINKFAIVSFESKGANIYRIEATTDTNIDNELYKAIKPYNDEMIKLLNKAKGILDNAKENKIDLPFNISIDNTPPMSYKDVIYNQRELLHVKNKVKELEKEYTLKLQENKLSDISDIENLIQKSEYGENIVARIENYDINVLKQIIDNLIQKMDNGFIFIANVKDGNVNYISKCHQNRSNNINCGELVNKAALMSNGNGGGSKVFAQGGGISIDNLNTLLNEIKSLVNIK